MTLVVAWRIITGRRVVHVRIIVVRINRWMHVRWHRVPVRLHHWKTASVICWMLPLMMRINHAVLINLPLECRSWVGSGRARWLRAHVGLVRVIVVLFSIGLRALIGDNLRVVFFSCLVSWRDSWQAVLLVLRLGTAPFLRLANTLQTVLRRKVLRLSVTSQEFNLRLQRNKLSVHVHQPGLCCKYRHVTLVFKIISLNCLF